MAEKFKLEVRQKKTFADRLQQYNDIQKTQNEIAATRQSMLLDQQRLQMERERHNLELQEIDERKRKLEEDERLKNQQFFFKDAIFNIKILLDKIEKIEDEIVKSECIRRVSWDIDDLLNEMISEFTEVSDKENAYGLLERFNEIKSKTKQVDDTLIMEYENQLNALQENENNIEDRKIKLNDMKYPDKAQPPDSSGIGCLALINYFVLVPAIIIGIKMSFNEDSSLGLIISFISLIIFIILQITMFTSSTKINKKKSEIERIYNETIENYSIEKEKIETEITKLNKEREDKKTQFDKTGKELTLRYPDLFPTLNSLKELFSKTNQKWNSDILKYI